MIYRERLGVVFNSNLGQGGASGYAEGIMRPDVLIVEGGRSLIKNPKRKEREKALLGESLACNPNHQTSLRELSKLATPSCCLVILLHVYSSSWSFSTSTGRSNALRP
jgi:cleavage and polyadenylation specificity factor subunit 2